MRTHTTTVKSVCAYIQATAVLQLIQTSCREIATLEILMCCQSRTTVGEAPISQRAVQSFGNAKTSVATKAGVPEYRSCFELLPNLRWRGIALSGMAAASRSDVCSAALRNLKHWPHRPEVAELI